MEEKLIFYLREMNIAKGVLSQLKSVDLDSMEIQLALCDRLNIQSHDPSSLLNKGLSRVVSQSLTYVKEARNRPSARRLPGGKIAALV